MIAGMHGVARYRWAMLVALAGPPLVTWGLIQVAGPRYATSVSFAYLIIVLAAAVGGGLWPGLIASITGFLMFNLFFIEPLHSLAVSTRSDVGVLIGFLATSLVVSGLVATVEHRRDEAERQAEEFRLLYDLGVRLSDHVAREPALSGVASLVEARLDLELVAIGVRSGGAIEVARSGDRSPDQVRDAMRLPPPGLIVSRATLGSGDELMMVAYPKAGRAVDVRQRNLLGAIAALAAAAADRGEQQHQRRQVEILQETDRQRSALLAAVSHDLRTPLAAITAAAAAVRSEGLSVAARDSLSDSITAESERLARMVSNLLELGRIEGGALVADREAVPVDELVGGVLARVRGRLGGRSLTLDVPAELPAVLIDPVQIDNALANLVDNVIAHTPESAGLGVAAAARAGWVIIRVTDDGPGVPHSEQSVIFERFARGSTSRSGSGLGLAIARAYAHASGGELHYAQRAVGSAFDLYLEAAPP